MECVSHVCQILETSAAEKGIRTIAIDRAMGARLLPVALDLFAATLVTSPSDSPPLLHRQRLRGQFEVGGGCLLRRGVEGLRCVGIGIILRLVLQLSCWIIFISICGGHGWSSERLFI